jgi:hypothetical protein
MDRRNVAESMCLVAVLALLLSAYLPFWEMTSSAQPDQGVRVSSFFVDVLGTKIYIWDTAMTQTYNIQGLVAPLLGLTAAITVAICFCLAVLAKIHSAIHQSAGRGPVITAAGTAILCLAIPMVLYFIWPLLFRDATNYYWLNGFFGSYSFTESESFDWSASYGWYLQFAAGGIMATSAVLLATSKARPTRSYPDL